MNAHSKVYARLAVERARSAGHAPRGPLRHGAASAYMATSAPLNSIQRGLDSDHCHFNRDRSCLREPVVPPPHQAEKMRTFLSRIGRSSASLGLTLEQPPFRKMRPRISPPPASTFETCVKLTA